MSDAGAVLADAQLVDAPDLRFDVLVAGVVRPDRVRGVAGALDRRRADPREPARRRHLRGRARDAAGCPTTTGASLIAHATRQQRASASRSARSATSMRSPASDRADSIAAALAVARAAASLQARIVATQVASLPRALSLAKSGCVAPDSSRNWNRDGATVDLAETVMPEMRALLTDPGPAARC